MNKILLLSCIGIFNLGSQAQQLSSENFNALTLGNIANSTTGSQVGQGGFYTEVTGSSTATSRFQIINAGGTQDKVLQITGSNTAIETGYLWNDDIATNWPNRINNNNILQVEVDLFTGDATTSKNNLRIVLLNDTFNKTLAGFNYIPETRTLNGLLNYNNNGTVQLVSVSLAQTPLVLPANQWVRIGFSFNKTTGEVKWKGQGFYGSLVGASSGIDPYELDFITVSGAGNTNGFNFKIDNLTAKAVSTENLLNLETNTINEKSIAIYPQPATDVISITNETGEEINSIELVDINGRLIKNLNNQTNSINISDLAPGVYMLKMNIQNKQVTKKIIKE